MAARKCTADGPNSSETMLPEAAERLRVQPKDDDAESSWYRRAIYRGTRDELTEAGIAPAGPFPGDPGGPVTSQTYERFGRRLTITIASRVTDPMPYWVRVTGPITELREREQAEQATKRASATWKERDARNARIRSAIKAGEYLPLSRRDTAFQTVWLGSREELISAGVCAAHHFPSGKKRKVWGHSEDESCERRHPNVRFWRTEALGRDHFEHAVDWSNEESEKRQRAGIGREPSERPALFSEPDKFSDDAEHWLCALTRVVTTHISGEYEAQTYGACTIRYDKKTVERVSDLLEHACQVLQAAVPIKVKTPSNIPVKLKAARQDDGFRTFLGNAGLPPAL